MDPLKRMRVIPNLKKMENINDLKAKFRELINKRRRPPLPSQETELLGRLARLSRHHIIPLNTIQDFAFTVTDFYDDPEISEALDEHFKILLEKLREIDLRNMFPDSKSEEKTLNLMVTIFEWLPGNIFYGPPPALRLDDPGPKFERHLYTFEIDRLLKTDAYPFNMDQWLEIERKFMIMPIYVQANSLNVANTMAGSNLNEIWESIPELTFYITESKNSEDVDGTISCYALKLFEFLEKNYINEL
uniref:Uncharacterized protein n=1 Tax=Megaselia scalaris TaxID=36166 RepID=T1GMZ4_MEGSC